MSPVRNNFRSGPDFDLDVRGLPGASRMLTEIAERSEDMRTPMQRVKALLIEGHKKQFATQGRFLGTPWPENAPETLRLKSQRGIPSLGRVMVASGDLEQSLAGGPGSRSRVSRSSVSVGTNIFYAIFAMRGTKKGEPARPPVGTNEEERDEAARIIRDFLLGRR